MLYIIYKYVLSLQFKQFDVCCYKYLAQMYCIQPKIQNTNTNTQVTFIVVLLNASLRNK